MFLCFGAGGRKPSVNFINVLGTAFAPVDPKSVKGTYDLTVFFHHSGSTSAKAVHRTLMKLTPGVDFINVQHTAFTLVDPKSVKITV